MITKRHKVFISFHHANDEYYRNQFEHICSKINDVIVNKSVQIGDIDPNTKTDRIRQIIRDKYLRDSTVTVVLIGQETWKRKHVDWEIGSSLRHTQYNSRSGLIGIFLPTYALRWDAVEQKNIFNQYTIPPRLYKNWECGYASLYQWSNNPFEIQDWIHAAFERRNKILPDNTYPTFRSNRSTSQWSE